MKLTLSKAEDFMLKWLIAVMTAISDLSPVGFNKLVVEAHERIADLEFVKRRSKIESYQVYGPRYMRTNSKVSHNIPAATSGRTEKAS